MSTINDVAKLAGVSTATVSRVLNDYAHVSPAVLEKVMGAIDQLGYEPNQMAKSLRTLKTSRLIVTVPNIANAFFANIIRGVEEGDEPVLVTRHGAPAAYIISVASAAELGLEADLETRPKA